MVNLKIVVVALAVLSGAHGRVAKKNLNEVAMRRYSSLISGVSAPLPHIGRSLHEGPSSDPDLPTTDIDSSNERDGDSKGRDGPDDNPDRDAIPHIRRSHEEGPPSDPDSPFDPDVDSSNEKDGDSKGRDGPDDNPDRDPDGGRGEEGKGQGTRRF